MHSHAGARHASQFFHAGQMRDPAGVLAVHGCFCIMADARRHEDATFLLCEKLAAISGWPEPKNATANILNVKNIRQPILVAGCGDIFAVTKEFLPSRLDVNENCQSSPLADA